MVLGAGVRTPASSSLVCCRSLVEAPLSDAEATAVARVLEALADPVRLRLLSLVATLRDGEACACDMEALLGRSQPTISHHTKVLAEAGLIVGERRGRRTWWKVAPDRLAALCRCLGG